MKENIKEAAENYANYNEQINKAVQEAVKFGAKWQQEQDKNKYSEQDIRDYFYDAKTPSYQDFGEWFSRFKKKQHGK